MRLPARSRVPSRSQTDAGEGRFAYRRCDAPTEEYFDPILPLNDIRRAVRRLGLASAVTEHPDGEADQRLRDRVRMPSLRTVVVAVVVIVAGAWVASAIADAVADIDLEAIERPYVVVAVFVVFDALVPIFPSESLLNTGSILATQDGSEIEIWLLIVAGSVGAVVGDTLLYCISRTVLRDFMSQRVEQAQRNEQVADAFSVLRTEAPVLITCGRFVPGVRFVVGATMGLTRYPFPRFLLWDVIGGVAWASFACLSSAIISTAIGGQPILSIVLSAVITTALLGLLYRRLTESMRARQASGSDAR